MQTNKFIEIFMRSPHCAKEVARGRPKLRLRCLCSPKNEKKFNFAVKVESTTRIKSNLVNRKSAKFEGVSKLVRIVVAR